jgi:SAM-dependent methyltransferase
MLRKSVLAAILVAITLVASVSGSWKARLEPFVDNDVTHTFDNIYKTDFWSPFGDGSGPGSEPTSVEKTMETLQQFIKDKNVTTIIDAGCGACKWTSLLLNGVDDRQLRYTGVDASNTAVERARGNMREVKHTVDIHQGDIAQFDFPDADMLMCRDTLQHMSYKEIRAVLKNFAKSEIQWFLIGSYPEDPDNRDISPGDYFSINLEQSPFLMMPQDSLPESPSEPRKYIYVYSNERLRHYVNNNAFFKD